MQWKSKGKTIVVRSQKPSTNSFNFWWKILENRRVKNCRLLPQARFRSMQTFPKQIFWFSLESCWFNMLQSLSVQSRPIVKGDDNLKHNLTCSFRGLLIEGSVSVFDEFAAKSHHHLSFHTGTAQLLQDSGIKVDFCRWPSNGKDKKTERSLALKENSTRERNMQMSRCCVSKNFTVHGD